MATWMTHLRIADNLLDRIPDLSPIEFIMGNLAPDSGVPNPDGSFSPDARMSHFRIDDPASGKRDIDAAGFHARFLTPDLVATYNERQYSFYLGYYVHLLTDRFWSDQVAWPTHLAFPDAPWEEIKENWRHLDRLYLKERPGFRAFRAYLGSVGFVNTYLDFFAPDALDQKRQAVTDFYLEEDPVPPRTMQYLDMPRLEQFIADCTMHLMEILR